MINVLLVDDLPENIFTLEHILDNGTRKFIPAASGAEALLLASLEKIDLILLDFKLDDMDGMEVAKQLRSNPITAHIPIIFVTAASHNERKKSRNFEIGTVDFLFKPIDLDEACTKVFLFEKIIRMNKIIIDNGLVESTIKVV